MADDTRQRITQWLEIAPSVQASMSGLLEEHERLRDHAEAAEHECARLRQELATARADNARLVKACGEIDSLIADGLGKANDALLRFRASLGAPATLADVAPVAPSSGVASAAAPSPEPRGPSQRRILVVDDDANFRSLTTDYLTHHHGYAVLAATSGEEALALLPRFQPQAVLLDLAMPGGGMWAIERIMALHPGLCVIVVTANDDMGLVRKARALGAADYVMKPFDLDYLGAVLDGHMTGRDAAPAPARSPLPPAMGAADDGETVLTTDRSIKSCFARR